MRSSVLITRLARSLNRMGLAPVNHAAKSFLRRIGRGHVTVEAEGLTISGTLDSWTILHHIGSGTFEPFEVELFKAAVHPGMTVLDIGANIGFYTLLAAQRAGPAGRVFAFEPDPRSRASLEANLAANGLPAVTVVPKAVAARGETRSFYQHRETGHSTLHHDPGIAAREITVETVSVDEVVTDGSVDVVKMDIEGEEPAALAGMAETLGRSPAARLFVEFAPAILTRAGHDPGAFLQQLREWFPSIQVLDARQRRLVELGTEAPQRRVNLVCDRRP